MRGGVEPGTEMKEIPKKGKGTIILTKYPPPTDAYIDDNIKESFLESFPVEYEMEKILPPSAREEKKRTKHVSFIISEIKNDDGVNLLKEGDKFSTIFRCPKPPSESYVLSSGGRTTQYTVVLGETTYLIVELITSSCECRSD